MTNRALTALPPEKQESKKIAWTIVVQWATLNMPDSVTAIQRLSREVLEAETMKARAQAAEARLALYESVEVELPDWDAECKELVEDLGDSPEYFGHRTLARLTCRERQLLTALRALAAKEGK